MTTTLSAAVLKALGSNAARATFQPMSTGFSTVGIISIDGRPRYFLKSALSRDMIEGEAESYRQISAAVPQFCPDIIAPGSQDDGKHFLITSYLDFSRSDAKGPSLAHKLAQMHKCTSSQGFGFPVNNCCADTVQDNT